MKIEDICSRIVVVALPGTSVHEGARLLREHHVGALVVIDSREHSRPLGIVTDRDMVVEVLAMGVDASRLAVGDLMSGDIVTVNASEGVPETIRLMQSAGVRRVVVVDNAGALVGIVSFNDLVPYVAEALGGLASAIVGAQKRERQLRA
jgi:CBS domain-containing protein